MTTTEVIIPFRGGCPHRAAALQWVVRRWADRHPDWAIRLSEAPDGAWCKAAAVMPAVAASPCEMIVMADADVWSDGAAQAVQAVMDGAAWAIPHLLVRRLTEDATAAVLTGADPFRERQFDQFPYPGIPGGGIVVARRTTLLDVPLDARYVGWGQEDESWGDALSTLVGRPWRGPAPLIHLWHPPQERLTRKVGNRAGEQLRCRYVAARNDRTAMALLVDNGRLAWQSKSGSTEAPCETC